MFKWVINNFLIKVISLLLAIITWFYVNEEISKEKLVNKSYLMEKR